MAVKIRVKKHRRERVILILPVSVNYVAMYDIKVICDM